jgi:hypothetical protein
MNTKTEELTSRKMLYPPPEREEDGGGPSTKIRSNSYEPFRMLDTRIEESLRGMAEEEQQRLEVDSKGVNGRSPPNHVILVVERIIDLGLDLDSQANHQIPQLWFQP